MNELRQHRKCVLSMCSGGCQHMSCISQHALSQHQLAVLGSGESLSDSSSSSSSSSRGGQWLCSVSQYCGLLHGSVKLHWGKIHHGTSIPMVARTLQEVSDICLVVVTSVMTGVGVMYAVRYRVCEGKHCQG